VSAVKSISASKIGSDSTGRPIIIKLMSAASDVGAPSNVALESVEFLLSAR